MKSKFQFFMSCCFFLFQTRSENVFNWKYKYGTVLSQAAAFVNSIVDGGKCNTFGYDKYVQNSDAGSAYTVTVKVVEYKPGSGSKEFQKVVSVPAGGKTYLGCSVSPASDGPSYTYTIVGESKA